MSKFRETVEIFLKDAEALGMPIRDNDDPGYIDDVADALLCILRDKTVDDAKDSVNFQSESLDETQKYRFHGAKDETWYEPAIDHPLFYFRVPWDTDHYSLMNAINDKVDDLDTADCCGIRIRLHLGFSLETDFGEMPKGTDFSLASASGIKVITFNVEWEEEEE